MEIFFKRFKLLNFLFKLYISLKFIENMLK